MRSQPNSWIGFVCMTSCVGFLIGAGCVKHIDEPGNEETSTGGGSGLESCSRKADGAPCSASGSGQLCLGETCVVSACGDGLSDPNRAEECDDKNTDDLDGCTQLCRFTCKSDADCGDGNDCNGIERCNLTTHRCQSGVALETDKPCQRADHSAGVCKAGLCAPLGCGDGNQLGTEACDDGNSVANDGCELDCSLTCQTDADCSDGNLCNGVETCGVDAQGKKVCNAGTSGVQCLQTQLCRGQCEPATGGCTYPDLDRDGASCEVDCADTDPGIFPGASECGPDNKDNDCNPATPDGAAGECKCYPDGDGDGYAASGGQAINAVVCERGYTRRPPTGTDVDCYDGNASVNPAQIQYFPQYSHCIQIKGPQVIGPVIPIDPITILCPSPYWNYNCKDGVEKQYPTLHDASVSCRQMGSLGLEIVRLCMGASGWKGSVVADCGVEADFRSCTRLNGICQYVDEKRTQGCR